MRLEIDDVGIELAPGDVPAGGLPLLDLAEAGRVAIESSCRSASCGTCLLRVLEGAEHLSPIGPSEQDLLDALAPEGGHRLACQARVTRGAQGRCVLTVG